MANLSLWNKIRYVDKAIAFVVARPAEETKKYQH